MKTALQTTVAVLLGVFFLAACDSGASLQKYYVDSKENNQFISVDIPSSIIQLKSDDVDEELKETLKTIKKMNFLALQLTEDNKEFYASEKQKVSKILKNDKYKQLMRLNSGEGKVSVNYIGTEDAVDEVIVFGSEDTKGFALVRVIGENMNPSDILKLAQSIDIDENSTEIKQLEGILSSIK